MLDEEPIRTSRVPEVVVPEVLVHSGQSDTAATGHSPLQLGDAGQEHGRQAGDGPLCPWCSDPVMTAGDTCDLECYTSWWGWYLAARNGRNAQLLRLEPDETPPTDLREQPWYEARVW